MGDRREHMIELDNLEIGFRKGKNRVHALLGPLSCGARSGELIAVMGRNGSGKSTLLRTVLGLIKALRGNIYIMGRKLEEYSRRDLARISGYVSTEVVRVPGLTVESLVALGRYPHTNWLGKLERSDREVIEQAIGLTGLQELRHRDLDELSDGERQRAMIARTLAQDTRTLLLDEPTAFLDLSHRYGIINLLGKLARDHGKTVLYSTHDLPIALQQADRIWLIHERELLEGAPEDLVLSGRLSEAFRQADEASHLEMDLQTGSFTLRREFRQDVSLVAGKGDPDRVAELLAWTRKALERNGFRVMEEKAAGGQVFIDTSGPDPEWTLEKSGRRMKFNSIYELSLYLHTTN